MSTLLTGYHTTAPSRPVIPARLAELDQWVGWRAVHRRGKVDKIPFDPRTGSPASTTDPATWGSCAEALAAGRGVGFVFTAHDPFAGVDIDDCRDPVTGEIHLEAQRIIDALASYAEVSPSGRGVKVFVAGALPASVGHVPYPGAPFFVELYDRGRYFTVTGEHLPGTPREVRPAQDALDALYATLRPPKPAPERATLPRVSPGEQAAGWLSLADARARFNAAHSLPELLRGYGATELRGGWSCPFCQHTHAVTLFISRQGKLFSFSPRCRLHTTHGHDAFSLACVIEQNNDVTAFLRAINPPPERRPLDPLPPTEAPEYLTPQHAERRKHDAARKRQERRDQADAARAEVERRMAEDADLTPCDRAVLRSLLAIAGTRGWCRPSKARLAEMTGYSLGAVKRSLMRIEGRYIRSEGDGGAPGCTAVRTFLRGSSAANPVPEARTFLRGSSGERTFLRGSSAGDELEGRTFLRGSSAGDESGQMIHEDHGTHELCHDSGACERGATPAPGDTLACWSWSDPPIGAADLALLAPEADVAGDAELRYALLLAAELPGPHPELEALSGAALRAWAEAAEQALARSAPGATVEPVAGDALYGPDGAVAYLDGAAWLPTDAARAWWETLPKAPRGLPVAVALPVPAPEPPPVRLGPPLDPAKARRYWALLGKAEKPGTSAAQAAALRRMAWAMREPQPAEAAPPAPAAAPLPASPAPAPLVAVTLPLFAGLGAPF